MKLKDTILEIQSLKGENEELKARNDFLQTQNKDLKRQLDELMEDYLIKIDESNKMYCELQEIKHMGVWEFASKHCTDEENAEAGREFARALIGGA